MAEPLLDLRADYLQIVRDILQKHTPQYAVWAFGSRAKWTAKQYSDLDLAVITDKPLALSVSAALADDFTESDLPFKVDVVDWATTSASFREIIKRDMVVVQEGVKKQGCGMSFKAGSFQIEELIRAGLLEIGDGYRAKNSELSKAGIPFARAANINDGFKFDAADFFPLDSLPRAGNKVSRPGDVVFTSKGTVGRFALVGTGTQQFVYSPQLCFWRSLDQDKLLPEYLYYWMNSVEFLNQIDYLKGQTDMADYVSLRDQRKITATIPDTAIQRGIVDVLKPIDDRIALLRETNATLEAIAQALFKSWFVDFDPVHAKQQGIDSPQGGRRGLYGPDGPTTTLPEGLDEATAALFPDSFEESALGLVPKGWRVGTLQDLLVLQRGFDLPASDRISGAYPLIAASGPSGSHNIPKAKGPGVVTGRSGVLGRVFLELEDHWPLNTTLWVKEFRAATPCYAFELLSNLDLASFNAGSAVPTLNRNHVHSLKCLIPVPDCVKTYEAIAIGLHKRARANQQQAQTLATLRDTLLPRLISGQLRLPEAEALLEQV